MGLSALLASSVGASGVAPPSGGGAQVGQPQGEALGKVPYWHMGRRHMICGQLVVPPVPAFQPPAPPAAPPDPPPVPTVIVVVLPPLARPPNETLPPPPTPPPLPVVVLPPLLGTPPLAPPPPLVLNPLAPPAAEPPLLAPPSPLDPRLESLVQPTRNVQAQARPRLLVDIVRIVRLHIVFHR